jgi:hypothetical protein
MKQLPSDIPDAIRDDCLHCMLWAAIGKFCREHPGHDSEDLLTSLAAVIGDQLVSPGSAPLQDEFIDTINRRIKQRIAFKRRYPRPDNDQCT